MEAINTPAPSPPDRAARVGHGRPRWSRRHPIAAMIARRSVAGIVTLFFASILIFAAVNVLPGNAASIVLGRTATPQEVAALEKTLGLDKPLPQRYVDWAGGIVS